MRRFLLTLGLALVSSIATAASEAPSLIRVSGLESKEIKAYVEGGYDIARRGPDFLEMVVTPDELGAIKKAGRKVRALVPDLDAYVKARLDSQTAEAKYLDFTTMTNQLQEWAKQYPQITRLESIGTSWEGREIWALKISDKPELDEAEPSVLLAGVHHAREWTTVEVPMTTARQLLEGYGKDERLTRLVDEREIWVVPMTNPDGHTWSQKSAKYWRKNRRPPASGSGAFGVDLNRNYGYHWAESGISMSPTSDTYPGPNGFSEPETQAIKALAEREKFQCSIAYHSYSELVLYPFAYAYNVPNPALAAYKELGAKMAAFNHYTVQNCTELYPAAGISDDWLYGEMKTLAFTFEMGEQFIPPVSEIAAQCAINVPATLVLVEEGPQYAVTVPSTTDAPSVVRNLDLTDGLAALAIAQRQLSTATGDVREELASRLQSINRRVAALVVERLAAGDPKPLELIRATPAARSALPVIRSMARFEACHGLKIDTNLLSEFDANR